MLHMHLQWIDYVYTYLYHVHHVHSVTAIPLFKLLMALPWLPVVLLMSLSEQKSHVYDAPVDMVTMSDTIIGLQPQT